MWQEILRRAAVAVLTLGISELAAWSKAMREKKAAELKAVEMIEAQRRTMERQADLIAEQKAAAERSRRTTGGASGK